MLVNNASGGFEIDPVSPSTLMPNIWFSLQSPSIPPPAVSDELDDHDMDGGDFTEDIDPNHSIRSAFVGPDNALFCNYHPGLTG